MDFNEFVSEHTYKDFPKKDVDFIDIFPIMSEYYPKDFNLPYLPKIGLIPEARGFLFYSNLPGYKIPLRKHNLPGPVVKIPVINEYSQEEFYYSLNHIEEVVNKFNLETNFYRSSQPFIPVYLFDDVLATGRSAAAIISHFNSIKVCNIPLKVTHCVFYLEISKLKGRELLDTKVHSIHIV